MNKLILFALTIICGIILYTCVSPVAAQGLAESSAPNNTYYSSVAVIAGSSSSTFLGVRVDSAESITIGFVTAASRAALANTNLTGDTIDSTGTNRISGTYPNISFQDGVLSGTITFLDDSQLKITFQQNNSPYFKMRDVICKTIQ
ncbi:hypothetical protein [Brachyspira catarrhinii]|uniref:Uncharacterized protein n=1 Tax=Brachyspira catarrhinii TaxID=2528966 RepID=A0ABY2TT94_9SPIR|nr:hypothetical protein [Brachyspira catarrhinii]TKZ35979.1 hypothetical protein EZH24_02445 [Brachyspira catarrhinii]